MRIYQSVSASITTKIDNIHFVEDASYVREPLPTPSATPNPSVRSVSYSSMDIPIAIYDVTDFGATKDDSTDDTAAFQNALDSAYKAGGGTVFAPSGKYKIATRLYIPPQVTLRGEWKSPDDGGLVL
jgi:hypothetical protein